MSQRMSGTESLWPSRVTQVIDPHYFWMQLGTRASLTLFEKLQRDMQEFGRLHFSSLGEGEPLEYGHVVLVDTGDAGTLRYKRGQVARISSGNSVDIFYVDYGNTELTTRDQIMTRLPDVFKNCPPQAVRCSLAAVRPISKNWTTRGTRMFQQATEGPLIYTLVLHGEPGYCEVSLYPSESEDARSVSHYLLEEEVAMPKDGGMVPEFVRDIPEFMTSYMNRVCSDKQKASSDGYQQLSPQQDPVTVETSTTNSLQPPAHSASPGSSPPSHNRSAEKYIPPNRKYPDQSPRSAGSHFEGSPGSHSSISSSPGQHGNQGSGSAKQPAVVDFFPFESVSTYPPTPVSPVKSPGRGSNTSGSQEGSYFSRSPSKYDHPDHQSYRGHYQQANGHLHRGKGSEGYYGESPDRGYYRNSSDRSSRKPQDHHQHQHQERTRFAANFDNLPASNTDPGLGLSGKANAAANLEPHYLNKISERNGQHAVGEGSQTSPVSAPGRYVHSPSRPIPTAKTTTPPFYPPKPSPDMDQGAPPQTLTTPQYYNTKSSAADGYNKQPKDLMPPGFYQSHKNGSPTKQPDPYYQSAGDGYGYMGKYPYNSEAVSGQGQTGLYSSDSLYAGTDYGYSYGDSDTSQKQQQQRYRQHQYYNHDDTAGYYGNTPVSSDYNHHGAAGAYNHHDSRHNNQHTTKPKLSNDNNSAASHHPPRPHIHIPHSTPTKSSPAEPYMHQKMSPVSPDSAGIAGFNFSELEHTEFASAEKFQQRINQEKLQALQEEAEDIAVESQEQSRLAEIARYEHGFVTGGSADGVIQDYRPPTDHEVFEQISEDISFASRENEDLKRSPVKHYREPPVPERAAKLEGMPASYVADIDFTEAVKEALDFARTDGIENAQALLDSVVESLRHARVEKQLFDVLLMLLSKAIRDYDLCHQLVMQTINRMNNEMEIKEPLTRALKRQQDLCVQVPVRKNSQHENFARVMAAIFNMAQDWSDSNATIQDSILQTVDKWILFNKKGTQLGQTEKEHVFLDCFVAFWQVSGSQLLRRNNGFTSRLEEGVKQKLLDENVIRTIRERLLAILLEWFLGRSGGGSPVRSQGASTEVGFSQTPRVTMIPSSCQVKPHTRGISTMTYAEWPEDVSGFDPDETRWHTAVDFNSPEVSINLRPMGQRSKVPQLSSTPDDSVKSRSRGKPNTSPGGAFLNSLQLPDQSNSSSAGDGDVAMPNSSINTHDKAGLHSADNSSNNASVSAQQSKVCDSIPPSNDHQSNGNSRVGSGNAGSSNQTSRTAPGDNRRTVCERKSAAGKTIVDWFDYQPEPQTAANKSPKMAAVKECLRQVKQNSDSLSLDSIEEKYSAITKGKSTTDTAGSASTNKSRKKEKKAAKAAANNQTGSKVVQSNNGAGRKANVDEATTAFDASAKADASKAVAASPTKNSPSAAKTVSSSASSVSAATASSLGALAETFKADEEDDDDGVKDWWGADEDFENRSKFPPPPKLGLCEIHVDTNPDVIIEDEFIEDVNDMIDTTSDTEPLEADKFGESEAVNEEIGAGVSSDSQSPLSQPEDLNPTKQSPDLSQENNEGDAKMEDSGARKVTVGDTFGFSEEMSDDNWDSDEGEGFGDHPLFENEMLKENSIDVNDQINAVGEQKSEVTTAVDAEDTEYNKNFPKTNLADYIRPVIEDSPSPEPVSRWKPKRRICLTCHDESHKTENCPKGIFLLQ